MEQNAKTQRQICSGVWGATACGLLWVTGAIAEEPVRLDEVSVTATRVERPTGDVPQAISVVGRETLADKKMFNVKEALQEMPGVLIDSKNGGSDARLIIRGAGLKATYGVREIMLLRDGVPLSDPDSFTRLDFVDTQDIERIEVAKGPGNLFAAGSVGGAIHIISKSVFDDTANNFKAGLGSYGARNLHLRYGGMVSDQQAIALTVSRREMENGWRSWNKFDTTQASLKHGIDLEKGGLLESEISYAESNVQLPGVIDQELFERFKSTGRQKQSSEPWQHSGRYSKVWFLNTRLEKEIGDITFKPRLYYNTWYHYHPITGAINETEKWVSNIGVDLETHWHHNKGTLVAGVTARRERTPDSRKYEYADVIKSAGRILATLSDRKGDLLQSSDAASLLTGVYIQESWRPGERWIIDLGMRYDVVDFDDTTMQYRKYDYATGSYKAGAGLIRTQKTFYLPAPKLAMSYRIAEGLNLFGMVARASQIPSFSELSDNPSLEAPISTNYEIGLKGRAHNWSFDTSVYFNPVEKEIVQQNNGGVTSYLNAGKTEKKGFEFSGRYVFDRNWDAGGYFSYTDYRYKEFTEPVRVGATTVNKDRSGNTLPFIPRSQYGLFAGWTQGGWRARVSTNTWGSYWMDSANTERYGGWDWVTNLAASYQWRGHSLSINVDNLFNKRYAMEAKKDTAGKVTYSAAAPRALLFTYRYDFH
ncbi:TonB-dependent receptor [Azonexus sp.]|jgi:iron complex outermembrane receptor protein|uniref:TonB-dependent receptor n=1 Tax=Azonexus sp. TaxID=1872668 RepID=UPI0028179A87|nr:TonB-dependent receptor [Azonexus sp.]MDR1995611.1 TonB-dependent receptor [Azonexus sp.]